MPESSKSVHDFVLVKHQLIQFFFFFLSDEKFGSVGETFYMNGAKRHIENHVLVYRSLLMIRGPPVILETKSLCALHNWPIKMIRI